MPVRNLILRKLKFEDKGAPQRYRDCLLHDLIGDTDSVSIVENAQRYSVPDIALALSEVEALLVPYPALDVKAWLYDIPAGRQLVYAQWLVHEQEAIRPSEITLMLYGGAKPKDLRLLERLIGRRVLRVYHAPQTQNMEVYALRPDVLNVAQRHAQVLNTNGTWRKISWLTPQDIDEIDQARRMEYAHLNELRWRMAHEERIARNKRKREEAARERERDQRPSDKVE